MAALLGIDIGTSGAKTLAIDENGAILASAVENYDCQVPKPLWSEQHPDAWWQAVVRSVHKVTTTAKLKPADVSAIGLSGQMHGSVFLDQYHQVLRPAILWNDQRTAAECEEIERLAGGRDKLIQMVANPAMTGFTAPKILWLRRHEPRLFEQTRKILLPKDEIRRRLTGDYATDVSDASGTLLLDVTKRNWSDQLLSLLQLDGDLLPICYESEDVTGVLSPEAAKQLGLSTQCRVVAGAGDCAAGAVGNGIVCRGELAASIGTSGVMFVHSDDVKVDPLGRVHTFCHAVRGKWHMMGVTLSAGGALQWFRNALCSTDARIASFGVTNIYALLAEEAAGAPPGSDGLFFLPYLSGERTPHADPSARGCFIGLTLSHQRGHMVRAVMEGVAYSMRESLEIFQSLEIPIGQIRASGGGSRSPLWRQIQADVFGCKVAMSNSDAGAAFGAALLAGVGAGVFRDIQEACQATIHLNHETHVDRRNKAAYDRAFPIYQQLYRSLRQDFRAIADLTVG